MTTAEAILEIPDAAAPPSPRPAALPPLLPATWLPASRYGFLETPDRARLRWAAWRCAGSCRATMVLLGGRSEFAEKYAMELTRELLARELDVHTMDWRGQGLSSRPLPQRHKGHIDSFDTYKRDLELFLAELAALQAPKPWIVLAHSMGGHTTLRHLAEAGAGTPLAGALLCAPMTGLRREPALRMALMLLPEHKAVEERFFVYGSPAFRIIGREFDGNRVTHDERRFRFTEAWFRAEPRLALGGPTVGWLRQAMRSIRKMEAPGYLERIRVPVAILSAGQDQLVESSTHQAVARRIAQGQYLPYADARHEIMMETDPIRTRFLADLDRFLAGLGV